MPKHLKPESTQTLSENHPQRSRQDEVSVFMLGGIWEPVIFSYPEAPQAPQPSPEKKSERKPTGMNRLTPKKLKLE